MRWCWRTASRSVVECPGDFESLTFPAPFGTLEAFTTSGGTSTLPETYRGRVPRLNYKTIRYPGHGRSFLAMKELGLFSSAPVVVDGVEVKPRAVFAATAGPVLDRGEPDVILLRVTARGVKGRQPFTRVYTMIEYPDTEHGLTAMMRTTAYPATAVLMMLARGEVAKKGALPQERCIEPGAFLEALGRSGLRVEVVMKPEASPLEIRPGPAWRAAELFGCDMDLLAESLTMTPAERLRLHDIAVTRIEQLEAAMKAARDVDSSSD